MKKVNKEHHREKTNEERWAIGVPPKAEKGRVPRWVWLIKYLKEHGYTIGAEIGCHSGLTTSKLLGRIPNLTLYGVDVWKPLPREYGSGNYDGWDFEWARKAFERRVSPYRNRLTVLEGISWEMADEVEDGSLDFFFLDADHAYSSVVKDIKVWTPKLKPGGLVSGHDTNYPTVVKALNELVPNWKEAGVDYVWYAKKEDVLC